MKRCKSIAKLGMTVATFKAVFTYLDPGSGSLIVQLLVAVIVGILATFRFWKSRFLSLFGIKQEVDDEEDNESAA